MFLCLVFVMLSCQFITALWSPAGKELTSWLLFVMFICIFVTFLRWYPRSGVVLGCINSRSLSPFLYLFCVCL